MAVFAPCARTHGDVAPGANWTPARFFKVATGLESSGDEVGILEDDRCIDTGVFQQSHFLHKLGIACSPHPVASPTDQQHRCVPSRLVCRLVSGSVRAGSPPGSPHCGNGNAGVLVRSVVVLKCGRTSCFYRGSTLILATRTGGPMSWKRRSWTADTVGSLAARELGVPRCDVPCIQDKEFQPRSLVQELIFTHRPCRPRLRLSGNFLCVCLGPCQAVCLKAASCSRPRADWWSGSRGKRKRSWTADAPCRLDADCVLVGDSEQEIDSPWALIPDSDEPTEDAKPFLPRFLLKETLFVHSPYDPNQPRLRRNLLCRTDWLRRRGISCTRCAILSIRENRRLSSVHRMRTSQLRGAPHGAPVPACKTCTHVSCQQISILTLNFNTSFVGNLTNVASLEYFTLTVFSFVFVERCFSCLAWVHQTSHVGGSF